MVNKFIYLSGLPPGKQTLTYDQFNEMLKAKDPQPMVLFPGLKPEKQGKTYDELFDQAVSCVKELWNEVYDKNAKPQANDS